VFWWGKLFAGGLATLLGGPVAGLAAVGVGHQLDRELAGLARAFAPVRDPARAERLRWVRLAALFSLAGALAAAGALPAARRIAVLEGLLGEEGLTGPERARAQALFRDGQRADFPRTAVVNRFRRAYHRRFDIAYALLGTLLPLAEDSGAQGSAPAWALLRDIAAGLGVPPRRFGRFATAWAATRQSSRRQDGGLSRRAAAEILGVPAHASREDITRAYRRALSRHHPDKLAHQDPPPEVLAQAAHRTDQIRKAYRRLTREQPD
jgi:DnaJ like chaperone protein